jgi:hypothetical protein
MYSLFKTSTPITMSETKNTIDIFELDSGFDCHINGCTLRFDADKDYVNNFESAADEAPREKNEDTPPPTSTETKEEEEEPVEKEEEEKEEEEENEEEETSKDGKIYVISVNGITYYYEYSLEEAQKQMMTIAKNIVGELDRVYGDGHVILSDHNQKEVKIVAPYSFFMLTYNYVLHELSIDYATKLQ